MGIYLVLRWLPAWLNIVLTVFPGYADLIGDRWWTTDELVDDLLR